MINFTIDELYADKIDTSGVERAALSTLQHQNILEESDITIVFSGDEEIQALNRQYLGNDMPTDVLSFPGGEVDPDTGREYLGDIIISYPQASQQAQKGGHAAQLEIELLVVHGVLHLLGHDHADREEKQAMWSAQREILLKCNNSLSAQF